MTPTLLLTLLISGSFAGFLAGLLGIGGGLIVVPMALFALSFQGYSGEALHHSAIGTSFGVMIFTTLASVIAQQKRKAIDWSIVRSIALGTALGTLLGSSIASQLPGEKLQVLFVFFCYAIALKNLFNFKPQAQYPLPKFWGLMTFGSGVGFFSSLLGIGGGVLNLSFLLFCSVPMKKAAGVSSSISFLVGLFGFLGYVYSGWDVVDLPPYSLGYCNLPITASFALATTLIAPLGVKASHHLPEPLLKKIFALLMVLVGTKMLVALW